MFEDFKLISEEEERIEKFNKYRLSFKSQAVGFAGLYVAGLVCGFIDDNHGKLEEEVLINFLDMSMVTPIITKFFNDDLHWQTAILETPALVSGFTLGYSTNKLLRGLYS